MQRLRPDPGTAVAATLHQLKLKALQSLASKKNPYPSTESIHQVVEACQLSTRADGCVICALRPSFDVLAASGLIETPVLSLGLRAALAALCARVASDNEALRIADIQLYSSGQQDLSEILALGCRTALVVPIVRSHRVMGAIVLLCSTRMKVDESITSFIEAASALLSTNSMFGNSEAMFDSTPNQRSTTGIMLLGASVAHQLEGPVSALDLQLEEQRRLMTELRALTDASDNEVWGTLTELAELTDEISAAVSRIRETTHQLTQLGNRQPKREAFDVAHIAREAVAILRPALEAQGIVLDARLVAGGVVCVQRDAVLQVVLDLVTIAAEQGEGKSRSPHVSVITSIEGDHAVLSVEDVGPALDDVALRNIHDYPFSGSIPDGRRRLVLRLAGDVAAAHGGHVEVVAREEGGSSYRLVLPLASASSCTPVSASHVSVGVEPSLANLHDVLIVDDDPIFSRSARRALRPHRVHESATASEAAFQLLQPGYTPSLVVCDLMLPGSDGTDLHARVRDARPELARRFLFVTGGTLSKATADYIRDSGCCAFQKPFDFARLCRQLSRCTVEALSADPIAPLQIHLLKPIHP